MKSISIEKVQSAFERIDEVDRPEVWISLCDRDSALADAAAIDARIAAGESLPLAGVTVAVKDNIDVAGLPTTAGCPAYAYRPDRDAACVARLRAAGAIVIGKTALDQFATGLVGTRSPYGAVRDWRRPGYVSGGSSSGSAIAVACGAVDIGLTTDTAGSGRVPAAFQGLYGIKPTVGLVPVSGVVPACRSFDVVGVLARELGVARLAAAVMAGVDPADPLGRPWPADAPLAAPLAAPPTSAPSHRSVSAPPGARIAVLAADSPALAGLSPAVCAAYRAAADRFVALGAETIEIDFSSFLEAGQLLYGGAFVAERYAAVGEFVAAHAAQCDPTVASIVLAAADVGAAQYVADREHLDRLRLEAATVLNGCDALLTPTVPFQPTIAEVAADPIEVNKALGRFTTFTNLLDLCAIALPFGEADGGQFGVTLHAPTFHDLVIADLAAAFTASATSSEANRREFVLSPGTNSRRSCESRGNGGADAVPEVGGAGAVSGIGGVGAALGIPLLVVGAHLRGGPLNHELTTRGARFLDEVRTAPTYRLFALATDPPKPGLVRAAPADGAPAVASAPGTIGTSGTVPAPDAAAANGAEELVGIAGELWALSPAALADFLAALPQPMALTRVKLADGREVVGFTCEPAALTGATEITEHGGWRQAEAARTRG